MRSVMHILYDIIAQFLPTDLHNLRERRRRRHAYKFRFSQPDAVRIVNRNRTRPRVKFDSDHDGGARTIYPGEPVRGQWVFFFFLVRRAKL